MLRRRRNRDRVALDLGDPPCHVAEQISRQRHIGDTRDRQRFAVIQTFELCEFFQVLLDQVTQLPYQAATLRGRHLRPGAALEGLARRFHRAINVLAIAFGNLRQNFSSSGVIGREGFPGGRLDPFSIDEHLARPADELLNTIMHLRRTYCGRHEQPPHAGHRRRSCALSMVLGMLATERRTSSPHAGQEFIRAWNWLLKYESRWRKIAGIRLRRLARGPVPPWGQR